MTSTNTDLIIIGGGAAGLMAGAAAGECGLRTLILESRPKPGRKLLMCGNNRCNITSALSSSEMLADYGAPTDAFLTQAITAFPPGALRDWCHKNGLLTKMQRDKRVYPQSERAADVHHLFTDLIAQYGTGLMINSPVLDIVPQKQGGFLVKTENMELTTRHVLIATGGVSYPKTGSVGDGQKMAAKLGHKILPFRPGLAGFDMPPDWLAASPCATFEDVTLRIISSGKTVGTTHGTLEIEKYGITGPAVVNASRLIARQNLKNYTFEVERGSDHWTLHPIKPRPLKEAMITVGGVALDEVDPCTMESKKIPGLYFAGEVLDVDGPSGGYNLQAAFSTARLAIEAIARKTPFKKEIRVCKKKSSKPVQRPNRSGPTHRPSSRGKRSTAPGKYQSTRKPGKSQRGSKPRPGR